MTLDAGTFTNEKGGLLQPPCMTIIIIKNK